MAENKRTPIERDRDLKQILILHLRGVEQKDIPYKLQELTGAEYELSPSQISYDLKKIKAEWRKDRQQLLTEVKNQQLDTLDIIQAELLNEWYRSKESKKRNTLKVKREKLSGGEPGANSANARMVEVGADQTVMTEEKLADPAYLKQVVEIIRLRLEVAGILDTKGQTLNFFNVDFIPPHLKRVIEPKQQKTMELEGGAKLTFTPMETDD